MRVTIGSSASRKSSYPGLRPKIRHQRDRTGTIKNEKGKGRTAPESYSASRLVVYDVMVALFSTVLVACLTRLSHT